MEISTYIHVLRSVCSEHVWVCTWVDVCVGVCVCGCVGARGREGTEPDAHEEKLEGRAQASIVGAKAAADSKRAAGLPCWVGQ